MKLIFKNASVIDRGYGLEVNGLSLEDIISVALGTRVMDTKGITHDTGSTFRSTCCDVTVMIEPQPVTEYIESEGNQWKGSNGVRNMLGDLYEQYTAEIEQRVKEK